MSITKSVRNIEDNACKNSFCGMRKSIEERLANFGRSRGSTHKSQGGQKQAVRENVTTIAIEDGQ